MPDILPRGRIELSVRRAPDGRCPELAAEVEPASLQPDSDIDLFLVVEPLPQVRFDRRREFEAVEARLASALAEARGSGVYTVLSPVIKTPEELCQGSFLHLDLVDQARILYDLQNILREHLADLAARLKAMGTQGVYKGGGYYWVLKLDYRWGNRIEL